MDPMSPFLSKLSTLQLFYEVSAPRQKQAIMKKCTPRRAPVEVVNPSSPASNTRSKKKLQLE
jgi:hypothetical protein